MPMVLPTKYNGVLYRSKTEARWAVFFELMSWRFEYEPECFLLYERIKYLPDFYLPDFPCYVEVKGKEFTPVELIKCETLCEETDIPVVCANGWPDMKMYTTYHSYNGGYVETAQCGFGFKGRPELSWWCIYDSYHFKSAVENSQNERFNWK